MTPQKTQTSDYRFKPGDAVRDSIGTLYTVVDRDGYAFLTCCMEHEENGTASGWYPQHEDGRPLDQEIDLVLYIEEGGWRSLGQAEEWLQEIEEDPLNDADDAKIAVARAEVNRLIGNKGPDMPNPRSCV